MSARTKKFEEQLNDLISKGNLLGGALEYEFNKNTATKYAGEQVGKEKSEKYFDSLPNFSPHSPYEPVFLMQFNADSAIRINALNAAGDMVDDEPGG